MKFIFQSIFSIALSVALHASYGQVMFSAPVGKPVLNGGAPDSLISANPVNSVTHREKAHFVVTYMGQSLKHAEDRISVSSSVDTESHFKAVHTKSQQQSDSLVLILLEDSLSKVRSQLRTLASPQPPSPNNLLRSIPSILPIRIHTWADYRVSSGYGLRYHPVRGMVHNHAGIDLPQAKFSPVYATADAVVDRIVWQPEGMGLAIYLKHASGYQTAYGHLNDHSVLVGELVSRGQVIGHIGETGITTGPHLHYSVLWGTQPVDPTEYCFLLMKTLQPARATGLHVVDNRKWKSRTKIPGAATAIVPPVNNRTIFKELKLIPLKPRLTSLSMSLMALSRRSLSFKQ